MELVKQVDINALTYVLMPVEHHREKGDGRTGKYPLIVSRSLRRPCEVRDLISSSYHRLRWMGMCPLSLTPSLPPDASELAAIIEAERLRRVREFATSLLREGLRERRRNRPGSPPSSPMRRFERSSEARIRVLRPLRFRVERSLRPVVCTLGSAPIDSRSALLTDLWPRVFPLATS